MAIITIQLDTEIDEDREILKQINKQLFPSNSGQLDPILTYEDFWARTSKRSREVLLAWVKIPDHEPYFTNQELADGAGLGMRRFHAVVANLGKWGKSEGAPIFLERMNATPPRYRLVKDFKEFLDSADIDAPCVSPGAKVTNALHEDDDG